MKHALKILGLMLVLAVTNAAGTEFEDYLPADHVDNYVAEQMARSNKAYFKIDNAHIEIRGFDYNEGFLVLVFDEGAVLLGFNMEELEFTSGARVAYGTVHPETRSEADQVFENLGLPHTVTNDGYLFKGRLENAAGENIELDVLINMEFVSAGASQLEVRDDGYAYLNGVLGTLAYVQIKDLIAAHPEIKTIVFEKVNGSVNDSINVHTGRLIRQTGLDTRINSSGEIASGGVDLFTSGNRRIVESGAMIGVHSWCCVDSLTADKLSPDHEGHRSQVEYFTDMLGDLGVGFYFFTLKSARFDGIHWMEPEEINKWEIATEMISTPEGKKRQ